MNKIKLTIYGLTFSNSQRDGYVLILGEVDSPIRLPIVIGAMEAQSIALTMEGYKTPRPLTHELFVNFAREFNIEIIEVIINKFEDGIFHASLICRKDDQIKEIDSRTSDAVALALRLGVPIYTYQHILDETGINIEVIEEEMRKQEEKEKQSSIKKTETKTSDPKTKGSKKHQETDLDFEKFQQLVRNMSIATLEELLQDSIEKEEYEKASIIRDELKRRKKSNP